MPALSCCRRAGSPGGHGPSHAGVGGPAADVGYVLIGLRRPAAELFTGIHRSSPAVPTETHAALRRIGLTWIDRLPLAVFVVIALTLGRASFLPEPHVSPTGSFVSH